MNTKRLIYRLNYTIRNFYTDHRYIVYLPLFVIFGLILGISYASSHHAIMTNFIDIEANESYNFTMVFMRELLLFCIVGICIIPCIYSKYFHFLAISGLILLGYRFGYIMTALVLGNTASGIINILVINIPFVLVATTIVVVFYALISGLNTTCIILHHSKYILLLRYIIIFMILYIFTIVFFHILIPKLIIMIFL